MSALSGDSDTLRGSLPRVLLVDDHPELLRAMRRFLATSCDIVGEATSGDAALEVVTGLKPDVVVLDLAMPGLNGLEACRSIRQALPQTQVIILTATDDDDIRQAALDAGASAFVLKHLAIRDLLKAIHNALLRELSPGQA